VHEKPLENLSSQPTFWQLSKTLRPVG